MLMNTEPILNRRMVKWIAIWAVWTLFAFFFTSQFALQNQLSRNPVSFWQILSWQMVSGYVWFALSPLILWLAQKFPLEAGRWRKSVPIHLFASVTVALFQQAIDTFALTRLGYPPNRQFNSFLEAYQYFIFV